MLGRTAIALLGNANTMIITKTKVRKAAKIRNRYI